MDRTVDPAAAQQRRVGGVHGGIHRVPRDVAFSKGDRRHGGNLTLDMLYVSFPLAVLAALSNATANVLQRVANRDEPDRVALTLRLIRDRLHRKVWLTGIGMDVLSFVLMA